MVISHDDGDDDGDAGDDGSDEMMDDGLMVITVAMVMMSYE